MHRLIASESNREVPRDPRPPTQYHHAVNTTTGLEIHHSVRSGGEEDVMFFSSAEQTVEVDELRR